MWREGILPFSLMCRKSIFYLLLNIERFPVGVWVIGILHTGPWLREALWLSTDCSINLPAGRSVPLIRHHHQFRSAPDLCKIFGISKGSGIAFNESSTKKAKKHSPFLPFHHLLPVSLVHPGRPVADKEALSRSCQVALWAMKIWVGLNHENGLNRVTSSQIYRNCTSKQLFIYKHPECGY